MLLKYDSTILEIIESIDSDDIFDFVKETFNISEDDTRTILPLDDVENQKLFKLVEDIIDISIKINNYFIIDIMDDYIFHVFYDKNNVDYIFNSNYIIWCENIYKKILESNDIYKEKHKEKNICPSFYNNRDLFWHYYNYDLIKHIPVENISIKYIDNLAYQTIFKNIFKTMFKKKEFLYFVYSIDPGLIQYIINKYNFSFLNIE